MSILRRLRLPSHRFLRDQRGVSAVEFALILPVLVLLYLGCVELSQALTVDRKVTAAASVVGDLVAQAEALSDTDFDNIFEATSAVLAPYDTAPLSIVVSYVEITKDGSTVIWSAARNGTARACGSTINIPAEVAIEGTNLVVAEAQYVYAPTFGETITSDLNFEDTFYLRPRKEGDITYHC